MDKPAHFYHFLEPISKELATVASELETSIFTSPRTMLTHARVFVENILIKVIKEEKLVEDRMATLKDRLDLLDHNGLLTSEVRDALHHVRKIGNQAAHDTRSFRYSEALLAWEAIYKIVKWYVEVYGPTKADVPDYQDPSPKTENAYDISELEVRLHALESLLRASLIDVPVPEVKSEVAATLNVAIEPELPGYTTIRTIRYKEKEVKIPYFLRDAFLLPQRFVKSTMFLIRLGAEQQARIMSELPKNLEGLHKHVKRYNENNDETFFEELKQFVDEEKTRRKLTLDRPGELFLFYKNKHVIVTEELGNIPMTQEEFTGSPSLLRQLNEDGILTVGQLPKELVILAKYENVGVGTVEKLFEQLVGKQANS